MTLHAALDSPLPGQVAVGAGTTLFVAGTCFDSEQRIEGLELLVDGEPQPVDAFGMPRLDFFAGLHPGVDPYAAPDADPDSPDDPRLLSYRSGFWGLARLGPGARAIGVRARLADGTQADAHLADVAQRELEAAPGTGPWPLGARAARVAIAMATYNPPPQLFAAQIGSIRAQTHDNWVCVVCDDRSSAEAFALIEREVAGDPRFMVHRAPRRLGFYGNFERALSLVPADADYVALADQDDRWYPDKLVALLAAIGSAQLVYSDARLVTPGGALIADTYWTARRNNHSDLLSLLVANSVTGAASLMRRDLLHDALPFPPAQFHHFHDHWLALVALCRGDIAFVDRPLYDYVQHGQASLGHATANRMTSLRERLRGRAPLRERVRMWRLHYFVDVCRLAQVASVLAQRCGRRMPDAKRRVLQRFATSHRSPAALATLAARGARELVGRPETLGAEWMLMHAFAWRAALPLTARDRPQPGARLDAVPPPSLALAPARVGAAALGPAQELADKIAPLDLAVSEAAPVRVNLLIPTVDLAHFFGGYIAKLNLAKRLARGGLRVRLLTTDPVGALAPRWREAIEAYSGLDGLFEHVEVHFGRGPGPVEVSPQDTFIATTWWTAHIAAAAARELHGARFVYLIQEYEPFTFAMGSYAALAAQSYALPHHALFSSELLRDYFRRHGIGVFAADGDSAAFQNAITDVAAPSAAQLAARTTRRLLFYARPEPHAARNMYELGLLALSRAVQEGVFAGWELHGIGTVGARRSVQLPGGASLELLPRSDQAHYAQLLAGHDVGLALMYTPHPSLVPVEMAAAGMVTVTSRFENKTPEALAAISGNLIAAPASIDGVCEALREAVARVGDHAGRARDSAVAWSRDWDASFDDRLLVRVSAWLSPPAPGG